MSGGGQCFAGCDAAAGADRLNLPGMATWRKLQGLWQRKTREGQRESERVRECEIFIQPRCQLNEDGYCCPVLTRSDMP